MDCIEAYAEMKEVDAGKGYTSQIHIGANCSIPTLTRSIDLNAIVKNYSKCSKFPSKAIQKDLFGWRCRQLSLQPVGNIPHVVHGKYEMNETIDDQLSVRLQEIWFDDILSRQEDAGLIHSFILGQLQLRQNAGLQRTFVLNLDSDWGSGKTFFLTHLKEDFEARGHLTIYINAWEDDHSGDPFVPVVKAIQDSLTGERSGLAQANTLIEKALPFRKSAEKIATVAAVGAGKQFFRKVIGEEALEAVAELLSGSEDKELIDNVSSAVSKGVQQAVDGAGDSLIEGFAEQKEVRGDFRVELADLGSEVLASEGKSKPIFILIDELDRCRPKYAVELLERVKHLFSVEDFVFILGTDTSQLAHAVSGLYGAEFDGKRYLKRFIDRTYKFQPAQMTDFVSDLFQRLGLGETQFNLPNDLKPIPFLATTFEEGGVPLRDVEQMMEMVATFVSAWNFDTIKVDLITLLVCVYAEHSKEQIVDAIHAPLFQRNHVFGYELNRDRPKLSKSTSSLFQKIASAKNNNTGDPRNSFDQWLMNKHYEESRAFGQSTLSRDLPATQTLAQTYPFLLGRLSRFHSEQVASSTSDQRVQPPHSTKS